jgi:hypothetical protein
LETLCRSCHQKEHGIRQLFCGRIMIYRDDLQFSRFIYWADFLHGRLCRSGGRLKARELWYLSTALNSYPPSPSDSCMKFHVTQTLETNKIVHTFI